MIHFTVSISDQKNKKNIKLHQEKRMKRLISGRNKVLTESDENLTQFVPSS